MEQAAAPLVALTNRTKARLRLPHAVPFDRTTYVQHVATTRAAVVGVMQWKIAAHAIVVEAGPGPFGLVCAKPLTPARSACRAASASTRGWQACNTCSTGKLTRSLMICRRTLAATRRANLWGQSLGPIAQAKRSGTHTTKSEHATAIRAA